MCFVEFEDVLCATRALNELYGTLLSNSVKGGIRLSYSKNPLGVRQSSTTPQQSNSNGQHSQYVAAAAAAAAAVAMVAQQQQQQGGPPTLQQQQQVQIAAAQIGVGMSNAAAAGSFKSMSAASVGPPPGVGMNQMRGMGLGPKYSSLSNPPGLTVGGRSGTPPGVSMGITAVEEPVQTNSTSLSSSYEAKNHHLDRPGSAQDSGSEKKVGADVDPPAAKNPGMEVPSSMQWLMEGMM